MLSQTFYEMKGTPFFQTSATTFRNFFTPKLLDQLDYFADTKGFESLRGDSFRNSLAFGYGKLYFENSTDSVWRCNVGIWGTLSQLEKEMTNMICHWELFEFYNTHFERIDSNAQHILILTAQSYMKSLLAIAELMRKLSFFKVEFKPDFIKRLDKYFGSNDKEKALNCLLYYEKILSDMGIVVNH